MNRSGGWKRGCGIGCFVLPLLALLGLLGAGHWLIVADTLRPVDAVVVLGGGGDARLTHAIRLYREQGAHWLILTETRERIPGNPYSLSVQDAKTAVRQGVDEGSVVVLEPEQIATVGEAEAIRAFVADNGIQSFLVVTDPFHTRRTHFIFRQTFDEMGVAMRVRPVENHWYSGWTWWQSRLGWQVTLFEYGKLAWFLVSGR